MWIMDSSGPSYMICRHWLPDGSKGVRCGLSEAGERPDAESPMEPKYLSRILRVDLVSR